MKTALVLNRAGGSLARLNPDRIARDVVDRLGAAGHDVDGFVVSADEVEGRLASCAASGAYDAVIVGGGDGTVSAAAAALADTGVALGVLPLGTLNLFARSLGMPTDLDKALDSLASSIARDVDLGEVNGISFVNHVSLGLHPRVIRLRERSGYSSRAGKLVADVKAWLRAVRRPRPLDISARTAGRSMHRRVSLAVVANNSFGEGLGHLPHSDHPSAGRLALYLSGALTRGDLLRMSGAALLGQWQANPRLEMVTADEIEVRVRSRRVIASVDGELVRLDQPMRFRSRRGVLKVMAPTGQADDTASA